MYECFGTLQWDGEDCECIQINNGNRSESWINKMNEIIKPAANYQFVYIILNRPNL